MTKKGIVTKRPGRYGTRPGRPPTPRMRPAPLMAGGARAAGAARARGPKPGSAPAPRHAASLDRIDQEILRLLQRDARMTSVELARRVRLSPPGLQKRVRRLERAGVIERYVTLVSRAALGLDLLCFVQVTLARHEPQAVASFREAVRALPEVLECHHLTGEFDYLLKVVVRNHRHLEQFLVDQLTPVPGVDRIRTSLALREIKAETALPLG